MSANAQGATASPALEDVELLQGVRARDARSFELLMRRYNRRLFRVARSLLGQDAEAEDAVQEAYLSAYRAAASFEGQASVRTWLTRIVVNECMTRLRRQGRRQSILHLVPMADGDGADKEAAMALDTVAGVNDSPERLAMRSQLRALLERRIDELPPDFRVVFIMRSVEDLSVEEAAACLHIPQATVRSRHFRARSLLRESLAQDMDLAERGVFDFDGERCDRIVRAVIGAME